MRRLLPLLLPALALLVVAGCPLDIRVRCDEDTPCATGEACVQGGCVRVETARVGDACGADAECGPGLTCGAGFPGGYCLLECSAGRECPAGSVCAPDLGRCLRACGEACTRAGYACGAVPNQGGPLSACVPAVTDSDGGVGTDGGVDGGTSGGADAGCQGTVALGGRCGRACECATAGATCTSGACVLACATDFECPSRTRCDNGRCIPGPRLGEACADSEECSTFSYCEPERQRCEQSCSPNVSGVCDPGYRCAPDGVCVEACTGVPETLGLTCENSLDCQRCGVCLLTSGVLRCRQPCRLDRDCPGGALGACEQVADTRACRL
jgi:hypothetical protein